MGLRVWLVLVPGQMLLSELQIVVLLVGLSRKMKAAEQLGLRVGHLAWLVSCRCLCSRSVVALA